MRIRCINTGSTKNLTKYEEYVVISEYPNYYEILNDMGLLMKYSKHLFEIVSNPLPKSEAEEKKINFNINDLKTTIDPLFQNVYFKNQLIFEIGVYLTKFETTILSGIQIIDDFDYQLQEICLKVNDIESVGKIQINNFNKAEVAKKIIYDLAIQPRNRYAFGLIAIDINGNFVKEFDAKFGFSIVEYMNSQCLHKSIEIDPNTGKEIVLWVTGDVASNTR